MTHIPRRQLLLGAGALTALAACGNPPGSNGAATIDARVDSTLKFLYSTYPGTRDLAAKSLGQLVMPLITKVGFGVGAAYGRGALRINGASVDYYSATSASGGLQIGAQQYAHVLFFMTDEALRDFRQSRGWTAGANAEYAFLSEGGNLSADTTTVLSPVIAVVFAQAGFRAGAVVEGTKYTRIIP